MEIEKFNQPFCNGGRGVGAGQLLCLVSRHELLPQSTQSAGPVRFFIFWLKYFPAGYPSGRQETPVYCSRECTPLYLSTRILNLLQPAQAEVVSGQLSTYLASWDVTLARLVIIINWQLEITARIVLQSTVDR